MTYGLFGLILVLAVGGIIWLRAAWVKLDGLIEQQHFDRDAIRAEIFDIEESFKTRMRAIEADLAHYRQTSNGDYADLLSKYDALAVDLDELLKFFNEMPPSQEFRTVMNQRFKMTLPDRLKMRLQ